MSSDDPARPVVEQPAEDEAPAARRPSPSAQAASRARRIGGRPLPGPRSTADPAARPTADPAARPTVDPAARPAADVPADAVVGADSSRPHRLRWIPAIVAGIAVAAMAVLLVWQSHGVWWAKASQGAGAASQLERQQVLAAAKTCTGAILTYDYRKLDVAERAGQACTTGQLKSEYTQLMQTTVKQVAPQTKTVQTLQVTKAGLVSLSADGNQWVVLLYGQQSVTSSATQKGQPRLDLYSAKVTLDRVGTTWLVSNLSSTS